MGNILTGLLFPLSNVFDFLCKGIACASCSLFEKKTENSKDLFINLEIG
jgi:hypothetical protein